MEFGLTNTSGLVEHLDADHVIGLTGYIGDASSCRQLQVRECYATAAPIALSAVPFGAESNDCPAAETCCANPEPRLFILGAKPYRRLSSFLLRSEHEQVADLVTGCAQPTVASTDTVATR